MVEAEQLRVREAPRTEIRFSGTPDYESSTKITRRNLPEAVSEHVDYYDVQVDYLLANRLRNGISEHGQGGERRNADKNV